MTQGQRGGAPFKDPKFQKIIFFKTNQIATTTIIIEKTQLGMIISILKGLGRYCHAETKKIDFSPQKIKWPWLLQKKGDEGQILKWKINFLSSALKRVVLFSASAVGQNHYF